MSDVYCIPGFVRDGTRACNSADASSVLLKNKSHGHGNARGENFLKQNYAVEWRRAHTDFMETMTDADFNIKNEPPSFESLIYRRESIIGDGTLSSEKATSFRAIACLLKIIHFDVKLRGACGVYAPQAPLNHRF